MEELSTKTRHIPLSLLYPWQARFVCVNSNYFCVRVQGAHFISYLTWWLFAWQAIGLNAPGRQGLHPQNLQKYFFFQINFIPKKCLSNVTKIYHSRAIPLVKYCVCTRTFQYSHKLIIRKTTKAIYCTVLLSSFKDDLFCGFVCICFSL